MPGNQYCCWMEGSVKCSASTSSGPKLFKVPKDPTRAAIWLERAGREDILSLDPSKRSKSNHFICAQHFPESMFFNSSRLQLLRHAVPRPKANHWPPFIRCITANSSNSIAHLCVCWRHCCRGYQGPGFPWGRWGLGLYDRFFSQRNDDRTPREALRDLWSPHCESI